MGPHTAPPPRARPRLRPGALLLLTALSPLAGCWNHVEDHCTACAIVDHRAVAVPRYPEGVRAIVVLVPGAFGFGEEWASTVERLRGRRELRFFAYRWPGPWQGMARASTHLAAVLQATLDGAPPSTQRVIVLAHSAGGILAGHAVRGLRPSRPPLTLAAIDAPANLDGWPFFADDDRRAEPRLGRQPASERLPQGVQVIEYLAADPGAAKAPSSSVVERVYLGGGVDHNGAVGMVSLPLLERLVGGR